MYKLLATALSLVLVAEAAVTALGPGATCSTIAGPTKEKCAYGLSCCPVVPDYSVCWAGACPKKFIPPGGLCSGFAGPVDGTCWPGTKCCYVSPDNSVCKARC